MSELDEARSELAVNGDRGADDAASPLGGPRTIVATMVTHIGSDVGAITPMLAQIEERTGQLPETLLADANRANRGLRQFLVRGLAKTSRVALLVAITTNLTQHLVTLGT